MWLRSWDHLKPEPTGSNLTPPDPTRPNTTKPDPVIPQSDLNQSQFGTFKPDWNQAEARLKPVPIVTKQTRSDPKITQKWPGQSWICKYPRGWNRRRKWKNYTWSCLDDFTSLPTWKRTWFTFWHSSRKWHKNVIENVREMARKWHVS